MSQIKYPEAFLNRMQAMLGSGFSAFMDSLNGPSPTSVRINPFKPTDKFDNEEPVPWSKWGRYLPTRPSFTFDPLFHAGTYYVQEASSMFVEQAWKTVNPDNRTVRVLDMCAAPGGKSTHLLSLMRSDSLLVSNEIIPNRNKILQENITKWGATNVIVTQNKPEDFERLENYFDIILIDAPCSGEGMFRKDKDAIAEWSEKNVEVCSARQKDILAHAVKCLKPGGFIIYSTCTYEPPENDETIEHSLKFNVSSSKLIQEYKGIAATKYGLQFFPHLIKGEGFYIALLQKEGELKQVTVRNDKRSIKVNPLLAEYMKEPESFSAIERGDLLIAVPDHIKGDYLALGQSLNVRHAGLLVGTRKGANFIPAHDLALSIHVKDNLPKVELTLAQSIAYLRCETIRVDSDIRGWALMTYQGHNLGWVKMLDNRINNYYPRELRILKQG